MTVPDDYLIRINLRDEVVVLTWDKFEFLIGKISEGSIDSFDIKSDMVSDIPKGSRKKRVKEIREYLIDMKTNNPKKFRTSIRQHDYKGSESRKYAPRFIADHIENSSRLQKEKAKFEGKFIIKRYEESGLSEKIGITSRNVEMETKINLNRVDRLSGMYNNFTVVFGERRILGGVENSTIEERVITFKDGIMELN